MRALKNFARLSRTARLMTIAFAVFMIGGTAGAQGGPTGPPPPHSNVFYQRIGPGPLSPDDAMGFVGFEAGLGGNTVTGAPYTATISHQSTEGLADGNRIQRTTSGTLARDSNGRTRRDVTLPTIGPWATSGKTPPHVVFINDPVAGANYILEPNRKTARKLALPAKRREKRDDATLPPFAQEQRNQTTTVSLGTQTMDGLTVQGTKTTRTIPAGAIGNEKPIEISVERWYSPDLLMNVMIKRTDPRTGENVFQLTNIQREEPDESLFQVPSGYTVEQDERNVIFRKGPAGPPPGPSTPQN
ncbi:MAG: hypothetical protein ACRD4Q_08075 [Candidatus Acidiferrales bacterium]